MHGHGVIRVLNVNATVRRQYSDAMSFTSIKIRLSLRSDENYRFAAFRTIEWNSRV